MSDPGSKTLSYTTARRTISETDVVTFVNTVGLHEPIFADMEYIKENMPPSHHKRFAPAPLIIAMGMGLIAPHVTGLIEEFLKDLKVGGIGGLVGLNARVYNPAFPGDTIQVEAIFQIQKTTSQGHTLLDIRHIVRNQHQQVVVDFTETILLLKGA